MLKNTSFLLSSPSDKQQTTIADDTHSVHQQMYFKAAKNWSSSHMAAVDRNNYNLKKRFNRTINSHSNLLTQAINQGINDDDTKKIMNNITYNKTASSRGQFHNMTTKQQETNSKNIKQCKTLTKFSTDNINDSNRNKILEQQKKIRSKSKLVRRSRQRASLGAINIKNSNNKLLVGKRSSFSNNTLQYLHCIEQKIGQNKSIAYIQPQSRPYSRQNYGRKRETNEKIFGHLRCETQFLRCQQTEKPPKQITPKNNKNVTTINYPKMIQSLQKQLNQTNQQLSIAAQLNIQLAHRIESTDQKQKQLLRDMVVMGNHNKQLTTTIQDMKRMNIDLQKQLKQMIKHNDMLKLSDKQNKLQKQIAMKQLNLFIERRMPKNVREFQSVRQLYLEQILAQLKQQINKSKSQNQQQMSCIIISLQKQLLFHKQQMAKLSMNIHMLNVKNEQNTRCLNKYAFMKAEYRKMKNVIKQLNWECEQLKQDNIEIRRKLRQHKQNISSNRGGCDDEDVERGLLRVPSQCQSLAFSISIEDK